MRNLASTLVTAGSAGPFVTPLVSRLTSFLLSSDDIIRFFVCLFFPSKFQLDKSNFGSGPALQEGFLQLCLSLEQIHRHLT